MRHVLIADDHAVTRRGIREIVRDAWKGVIVAEAADADEISARLDEQDYDLVLLDVLMPGTTVLESISRIRKCDRAVPILVLTAIPDIECVVEVLRAGAAGFIHKQRASDDLVEAIRVVANGGRYLHPETARAVASAERRAPAPRPHQLLSERELEVFLSIARGQAVKEIAGARGLSDKTVATYLSRIRDKTGLSTHVDIARYALQNRLVD